MPERITNIRVVLPHAVVENDLLIGKDGTIEAMLPPESPTSPDTVRIDGGGCFAFPGMIDLLAHGFGHFQYADAEAEAISGNSAALPRHGVTAFVPSVISKSEDELGPLLEQLSGLNQGEGARCLGIHSEGPCLAAPGAHKPDNLSAPSRELAENILAAANGALKIVTLAPELPGADEFMAVLKAAGVALHLGHSRAHPDRVSEFVDAGISAVTHMFDVMVPAEIEDSGLYPVSLADALLAEPRLCLGVICDGVHVSPIQFNLLIQLPSDRVFLETDSMKFTGLPPGRFEFDEGMWVTTTNDRGARMDDDALAGSTLTCDRALRNFVEITGGDLPRASMAASLNPARLAGLGEQLGSLEAGKAGDFVLLDDDLTVQATYVAGRKVWAA